MTLRKLEKDIKVTRKYNEVRRFIHIHIHMHITQVVHTGHS